jgi:hypothetical protein
MEQPPPVETGVDLCVRVDNNYQRGRSEASQSECDVENSQNSLELAGAWDVGLFNFSSEMTTFAAALY